MRRRPPLAAIAVALAFAMAGCQDPYAGDRARSASPATQGTEATPGDVARPGPQADPAPVVATHSSPSARRAARLFAMRWVNWDWRSVAGQQRALARLTLGDLSRALRADASSARIDASLARDKPGSRGTVAAIELKATDRRAAGIVVTREQTYTDDRANLGGQRYRVYLIRLSREPRGWGVSAWEPQP